MNPDESNHVFRNHPSVIASHVVSTVIVMALIIYAMTRDVGSLTGQDAKYVAVAVAVVVLAVMLWSYFFWKRTFYIFGDNELHVTRDAVWKMDKHIQYTRLASVGVRRDIFNRIFGTSTLAFNVNSSMNATSAEATLVLKKDMADRLRESINEMVFSKQTTIEEDLEVETVVRVTNRDVIVHAILGQPTYQALFGLLMVLYAVAMLFADSSGGFITAAVLFVISEVLPFVSAILKYYNYRIFRVGDTVTVESGLITTRRSSFKVNKVNSVRIREPLLARLFGKGMLEAEVVGISDEGSNIPLLCPLKRRADVEAMLAELMPELMFEPGHNRQPRRALVPMLIADSVFAVAVVAVCLAVFYLAESYVVGLGELHTLVVRVTEVFAAVGVPLLIYGHSGMAQRHRTFDMGPDSFMFVYGGYDICTEFINYDKVQYVSVSAGPLQRVFGLAKCHVFLMSSLGFREIRSGIFEPEDLERVGDEVMARIRDGRYDYRKYY